MHPIDRIKREEWNWTPNERWPSRELVEKVAMQILCDHCKPIREFMYSLGVHLANRLSSED